MKYNIIFNDVNNDVKCGTFKQSSDNRLSVTFNFMQIEFIISKLLRSSENIVFKSEINIFNNFSNDFAKFADDSIFNICYKIHEKWLKFGEIKFCGNDIIQIIFNKSIFVQINSYIHNDLIIGNEFNGIKYYTLPAFLNTQYIKKDNNLANKFNFNNYKEMMEVPQNEKITNNNSSSELKSDNILSMDYIPF